METSPRASSAPAVITVDGHNAAYGAFIWLGLGSLLSFNFFITADPYFQYKLRDQTSRMNTSNHLQLLYENTVTFCLSLPNLITAVLVTFIFISKNYKRRIYVSLTGTIFCLLICFVFIYINVNRWRLGFFILTMLVVVVQSSLGAVLLNCLFSLAGTLPSRYMNALMLGQSLGGLFVSTCSIISILFSNNVEISASIYFMLAILVVISNILTYYSLDKSKLLQIYHTNIQQLNNEYEPLLSSSADSSEYGSIATRQRIIVAFKHCRIYALSVFLIFTCTLCIYPGYMSKILPAWPSAKTANIWTDRLYAQVMTFLLFNVGDSLGRILSLKIQYPSIIKEKTLLFITILRFLFIPFIVMCHFPNSSWVPYVFKYDVIYSLLSLLFALSNGYFASLSMMYAPRLVHTQLSGTVGALMSLAMTSGIFMGSLLSYGFIAFVGVNKPHF